MTRSNYTTDDKHLNHLFQGETKMRKILFIGGFVGLVICLAASTYISAQPGANMGPGGKNGPGMGPLPLEMLKEHAKEIGLTDDQIAKIKDKVKAHMKETIQLRADKKISELDLREEMEKDTPDKKVVTALIDKINDCENKTKKSMIMLQLDLKTMVTPDQRAKIKAIMKERREHMRNNRMDRKNEQRDRREMRMERMRDFNDDNQAPPHPQQPGRDQGDDPIRPDDPEENM
jgi:periplasmic protein CpxP/Spy